MPNGAVKEILSCYLMNVISNLKVFHFNACCVLGGDSLEVWGVCTERSRSGGRISLFYRKFFFPDF